MEKNCCEQFYESNPKALFCASCGKKNQFVFNIPFELERTLDEYFDGGIVDPGLGGYNKRSFALTSSKYQNVWLNEKLEKINIFVVPVQHIGNMFEGQKHGYDFKKFNGIFSDSSKSIRKILAKTALFKYSDIVLHSHEPLIAVDYIDYEDDEKTKTASICKKYRDTINGSDPHYKKEYNKNIKFHNEKITAVFKKFAGHYYVDIRDEENPKLMTADELFANMHPIIKNRFAVNLENLAVDVELAGTGIKMSILGPEYAAVEKISNFLAEVQEPLGQYLASGFLVPKKIENVGVVAGEPPKDLIWDLIELFGYPK